VGGRGLESLNDVIGYAGGSLASGRATLARQALVERQTKRETLFLQVGVGCRADDCHGKLNCCEELSDRRWTALMGMEENH
jgi:hypothetical protein